MAALKPLCFCARGWGCKGGWHQVASGGPRARALAPGHTSHLARRHFQRCWDSSSAHHATCLGALRAPHPSPALGFASAPLQHQLPIPGGSWWNFRLRDARLTFSLCVCLSLCLEPSFQPPQHFGEGPAVVSMGGAETSPPEGLLRAVGGDLPHLDPSSCPGLAANPILPSLCRVRARGGTQPCPSAPS